MAIIIDWAGTQVITVTKEATAYMTLVQSNPSEIWELDLNAFRLTLRDMEDDPDGRPWPKTHTHNTEVNVGGVTLARVVEILDPYSVTFEDGQYAVRFSGANTNLQDKTNVNQVSIRPNNSAGLVTSQAIEAGDYGRAVTIDYYNVTGNAVDGTIYPVGTWRKPVKTVQDAILIAEYRGFNDLNVIGDLPLGSGDDVTGYRVIGQNAAQSNITINSAAETLGCEIREASVTGNLDGGCILRNCEIHDLNYVNGYVFSCMLGTGTISLGGASPAYFFDCYSGNELPVIDMNGSGLEDTPLSIQKFSGHVKLIHKTGTSSCVINLDAAHVEVDSTCVSGSIEINGDGKVTDENGNHLHTGVINGALNLTNEVTSGAHIHDIWLIHGLDKDNPVNGTPTQTTVGDITLDIVDNGNGTGSITRQ